MSQKLLTRDQFREGVFARDNNKCVFCDKPAQDAHHILERRLWPDGGYYLDNGASVCSEHHIKCETTEISVEDVRHACGITKVIIPPHLYDDQVYDKWGNPVQPNGTRLKGELFNDESVQKILTQGGVLGLFSHYVKYQRTYHLPWSPTPSSDDRVLPPNVCNANFAGKRVIATKKMDGENTTMYPDYIHARSVDSRNHPSRNWVKNFWGQICGDIPEGWRVCGENLFAEHSIFYPDLKSYFYGFSIWDDKNFCLPWNLTLEYFELMSITPVEVIYDGIYDEQKLRKLATDLDTVTEEGYVLRIADGFSYADFRHSVAKYVRPNHVQTVKHWMHGKPIVPNQLGGKDTCGTQ
jgi:hypothetical protein